MSKNNFDESEMAAYAQQIEGKPTPDISMPEEDAPVVEEKEEKPLTTEERRDLAAQRMQERESDRGRLLLRPDVRELQQSGL